jgi:hypothetical protein
VPKKRLIVSPNGVDTMNDRIRYLSGTLRTSLQRRDLVVDDGRFTEGFRIVGFELWPTRGNDMGDMSCVLATKSNGASMPMQAGDNRQIAWGYCAAEAQGIPIRTHHIPNEVFLEELIILAEWTDGFVNGLNYMITLEQISITESQAALVLINNKSQDLS